MKVNGKGWVTLFLVVSMALVVAAAGCTSDGAADGDGPDGSNGEDAAGVFQDGDFTGADEGGSAEVTLTIQNDQIVAVQIVEFGRDGEAKDIETYAVCVDDGQEPLLAEAHPAFISQMIAENTWEIDTFTGATSSSDSVREAAQNALEEAKVN